MNIFIVEAFYILLALNFSQNETIISGNKQHLHCWIVKKSYITLKIRLQSNIKRIDLGGYKRTCFQALALNAAMLHVVYFNQQMHACACIRMVENEKNTRK